MKQGILFIIVFVLLCPATHAAAELTYPDLVHKLVDLEQLAVLPQPGERAGLFSSYDRSSRYLPQSNAYVHWDAPLDGRGGIGWIRLEGDQRVLAEMQGPGCLRRMWSALPGPGRVRILLDGHEMEGLDLPFQSYFDGEHFPFIFPTLVHTVAHGKNSYLPIPFRRSCKIIADPDFGQYFHFNYTQYPRGTRLPRFNPRLSIDQASELARINKILQNCGSDPAGERPGQIVTKRVVRLSPNTAGRVLLLTGTRAITAMRVKVDLPDATQAQLALRQLTLAIKWEREKKPSVWSPLGDFFASAPGANVYHSLPMGYTEDGWFYSYWYMPFEKRAQIELHNDGPLPREATFEITHTPLQRPIETLGRFHAKWHRDASLPVDQGRENDWTFLHTRGRGRYCGVHLHVYNPGGDWWSSGDDKFFIDGEKQPSLFGTDTDDYFGLAFSSTERFEHPFHNQFTSDDPDRKHTSLNRWHIADQVPFQSSFEGVFGKSFSNDRPTLYACTAYWYTDSEGEDLYQPVPVFERTGYLECEVQAPRLKEPVLIGSSTAILETETAGAEIRYTTDATDPGRGSHLYENGIPVSQTTAVRARAYRDPYPPSPVAEYSVVVTDYLDAVKPETVIPGLRYRYYEGWWGKLPDFNKLIPVATGTTDSFRGSPALFKDRFGLRLEGYIKIPCAGIYTFYLESDDGSKLWIGGQEIVSNDGIHRLKEESGVVALRAGLHPIRVDYFESELHQHLKVAYKGPGIDKQPIPAEVLFY